MQTACIDGHWIAYQFRLTLGRVLLDYIIYGCDEEGNSFAETMRCEEVPREVFLNVESHLILRQSIQREDRSAA